MLKTSNLVYLALAGVVGQGCVLSAGQPVRQIEYVYRCEGPQVVRVTQPPPPVRVEVRPTPVRQQQVWVEGYWDWQGSTWSWRPGRWEDPRPGVTWIPPRYDSGNWQPGYWGPPTVRQPPPPVVRAPQPPVVVQQPPPPVVVQPVRPVAPPPVVVQPVRPINPPPVVVQPVRPVNPPPVVVQPVRPINPPPVVVQPVRPVNPPVRVEPVAPIRPGTPPVVVQPVRPVNPPVRVDPVRPEPIHPVTPGVDGRLRPVPVTPGTRPGTPPGTDRPGLVTPGVDGRLRPTPVRPDNPPVRPGLVTPGVDGRLRPGLTTPGVVEQPHPLGSARCSGGPSPNAGVVGSNFTLGGQGFGTDRSRVTVTVGNIGAAIRRLSDTSMLVEVPPGTPGGAITVRVGGVGTTCGSFTVQAGVRPRDAHFPGRP